MELRRVLTAGAGAALLIGGVAWTGAPAGAAEGFTLTPTEAAVGSTFTITASLPEGGTPCTTGAGVRIELLPPADVGDQVLTENGEGDPSPGGIWTIQLDVTASEIATPGDYRVVVTCASQDLTYGPEILAVSEPTTTTTAPATTTTAPPAAAAAVAASPAFTG
jgi:hypothetical protein